MSLKQNKKKVLIISHDKVGPSMAGPGIRYHNIATTLASEHDVTLGVFNPTYIEGLQDIPYTAIDIHVHHFQEHFSKFDVIIALWLSDEMIRYAKEKNIVLIFDLYAPVPVEDLVQRVFGRKTSKESDYDYNQMLKNYSYFIRNADFTLSSNPQQRDFWLGYAFASNKIAPSSQSSRSIDSYFGICPMGIDLEETVNIGTELLSTKLPTLKKSDFVIVWTGGIWDWFDGSTPIKAMKRLSDAGNKNIKLVFLGTKHPNDDVPAMRETDVARDLAAELSVLGDTVHFLDGWLPYSERTRYLKRADVALYSHKPSIESRFSHRTRVLDHILMSLPTIASEGDYLSDYLSEHDLGISVPVFDEEAMASAILDLSTNSDRLNVMKSNILSIQKEFEWDTTLNDLKVFLNSDYNVASKYIPREENTPTIIKTDSALYQKVKRLTPKKVKSAVKRLRS